jgi:hypothetical protein
VQGATAEMTREAFQNRQGALVSASRSILYAHRDPHYSGNNWKVAVASAVTAMQDDLSRVI